MSSCVYEQYRYEEALEANERAYELAPKCWLVLWNQAGALETTGQPAEAIKIYQRIRRSGVEAIASGPCSFDFAEARGAIIDSAFMIGSAYKLLGRRDLAIKWFERHLAERTRGIRSNHSRQRVLKEIKALTQRS